MVNCAALLISVAAIGSGISRPSLPPVGTLAQERAAARAVGLALSAAEVRRTAIPAGQNAAALWSKARQTAAAVAPADSETLEQWNLTNGMTPEVTTRFRAALTRSDAYLQLIHRISERPRCDFGSDFGKGAAMNFLLYAQCRRAVRWLRAESLTLTGEAKPAAALEAMGRAFVIGRHAASDHLVIGQLVTTACDAITARGLEDVLYADPALAPRVRQMIAAPRSANLARESLRNELVIAMSEFGKARAAGPKGLAEVGAAIDGPALPRSARTRSGAMRIWSANIAYILWYVRQLRAATGTMPEVMSTVKDLTADLNARIARKDPAVCIAQVLLPVHASTFTAEARRHARLDALDAFCAVLIHRSRHGALPSSLAQAMSVVPVDARSNTPLRYRREGEGFVVYSAGEDGKFDGGAPGVRPKGTETAIRWPRPSYRP